MALKQLDVLIIGAGAAGLMCAATAGYRGRSVWVLDHAPKAAAKIRISGGGNCNFTNQNVTPEDYLCQNPHFVKSALARYQPQDFIELVERHGIDYEVRDAGKYFCTNRAGDLIHLLLTECDWAGVEIKLKQTIQRVEALLGSQQASPYRYQVQTDTDVIQCHSLVIATGGLSFPKLKASRFGYDIAQQFGISVIPQRPGLVPLVMADKALVLCQSLSGLSLDVSLSIETPNGVQSVNEAMLFTHFGISGPAVLKISNYWQTGAPIAINLMPNCPVLAELETLKAENGRLKTWLNQRWPKKFTQAWLNSYPQPDKLAEVPNEQLIAMAKQIQNWQLYPAKTAGYDKAEVTLGGVDTDAISSKTMECLQQPHLYFIGEVLDVTGQLGGYNFQWAWASAVAAGQVV
ncbi:aminoacetone oxidase family FAD-binding enzyme [Hydrogenovibrio sp. SC-1]|uniref:NAD(P)/FAD-dependent oxidoreductase n=1 Tax=Hydrogenovibrio sp. SC-1 TaxID=2065820 RepID=UPI000C7A484C|nr:NAD(P)/FAD-dependent oxidoreductase [Hydrogenovibrio sp. SC-1]PLA75254.1 aminoacetone oxidase family FAD-binding enzyme [Hydrogenovibrio sp. SC-1]